MKIQSLKLVCFSPTGTTKAVIQGIAQGIDQSTVELIDITKPNVRKRAQGAGIFSLIDCSVLIKLIYQ